MAEEIIKELINSANIMMAGPNEISSEQRHAAEKVFLDFQKMRSPFMLCKHLLETCQNDYVLFQTVALLKSALIREWPILQPEEIESLRTYLLHYLTERISLKCYVREQITMVLAIMVKRGSVMANSPERETILNEVSGLIASGNPNMQTIGCSLLTALLNEYSSSVKSSDLGLTWETHLRAKKNFEGTDMQKILQYCVEGLSHLEKSAELTADLISLTQKMLSICSQIMMWNFQRIPIAISRRIFGLLEAQQTPSLRPPVSWKSLFLKPDIVHIFFKIHWKIRHNRELAHLSLQCLAQLASVNGGIFGQTDIKLRHLNNYIQSLLEYLTSCDILDHEALGISSIFSKFVMFHPSNLLSTLPQPVQDAFFNKITEITCNFACKAALEESTSKDDQIFMEAYGQMLEGWMSILNDTQSFVQPFCRDNFIQMFNCYLQCHLSAPDGNRGQGADVENEEIDELEEDDRSKFKDQLSVIGLFGRKVLDHSLPLLYKLIEERVGRLHGQLQRILQQSSGMNIGDSTIMNMLCEDIHWLVLIGGHVLVLECKGETALIPSEINSFSMKQTTAGVDVNVTLQVLGSPGQKVTEIPGSEQSSDHVVRLISAMFRLCEVEKRALEANLAGLLSPEVATTIMWFLKNWVSAYLLPNENCYSEISPTLTAAFGRDSEAGAWTVNFILSKLCSNLIFWNSEASLMEETVSCMITLVDSQERSSKVLKSHEIWNILNRDSLNELVGLQPKAKRGLYRALILAGSNSPGNKETYFTQILNPLHEKFQALISRQDFDTVYKDEPVKAFIINFVESLIGVADGCETCSGNQLLQFLLPIFSDLNRLLAIYHSYNQIVKLILEFYLSITKKMFCFNNQEISKKLYESYVQMIQTYTKHNKGKQTKEVNAEEEQYEDLQIMLVILIELISKDILDMMLSDALSIDNEKVVCGADVAMYGLRILMPLMTYELLKFPSLCKLYYKLITFASQMHPRTILSLPADLLGMILQSVELGLTSFSSDIALLCLELLADLASDIFRMEQPSPHREILQPFLKVVMNLVLFQHLDTDRCSVVSCAVFTLICCYQDSYRQLVEELIKQQSDPIYQRRLVQAFNSLTTDVDLTITRHSKIKFRDNFEKFIIEVQGILCVK